MNIILTLSLKGSCMVAGYYLLHFLMGKSFSHRMRYLWLKLSLISYLLPFYWLKEEIAYRCQNRLRIQLIRVQKADNLRYAKALLQDSEGMLYPSLGLQKEIWFVCVWCGVGLLLFASLMIWMCRTYSILSQNSEAVRKGAVYEKLLQTEKELSVRRRAKLLLVDGSYWCSGGLLSPFIVMKKDTGAKEAAYILKHELTHIKRMDSLFKAFIYLALFIHWFNPLVYLLKWQMEWECEMSCDDEVLKTCLQEKSTDYANIVADHGMMKTPGFSLALNLEKTKEKLEERIKNILDKKEKNMGKSIVCMVLMAVILVGSSFTVLAYDHVPTWSTEMTGDELKDYASCGDDYFYEDDEENLLLIDIPTILYEEQFIDEEGNLYELTDTAQVYAVCEHQYTSGKKVKHIVNQTGGCTVAVYQAQQCGKCGNIILGELIYTLNYPVCPH